MEAPNAAAAGAITLALVVVGFPYERLSTRILAGVEAATGARVSHAGASQTLSWKGPIYAWHDVSIRRADRSVLQLDRLDMRLAPSPAWLRGMAAFDVTFAGPAGGGEGTVTLGPRAGFELRWVDQVPRAVRVRHQGGLRQALHQRTGTARMVEVHVGHDHVADFFGPPAAASGDLQDTVRAGRVAGLDDRDG